jgi:hypothetical protein
VSRLTVRRDLFELGPPLCSEMPGTYSGATELHSNGSTVRGSHSSGRTSCTSVAHTKWEAITPRSARRSSASRQRG